MAYVTPTIFAAGNIPSAGLATNNTALRTYLNVGIVTGDILDASVNTTDIVKGEFYGVIPDHQFTTGDMYTQFNDILLTERILFTAHTRPFDMTSDDGPYSLIANSGKRIVLEKDGSVIYSVGHLTRGFANPQLSPSRLSNDMYVGHAAGDVLVPDTDIQRCTRGRCFTEDGEDTLAAPVDSDASGNVTYGLGALGLYSRRYNTHRFVFPYLTAGIHHFYMAIVPRCDGGEVICLSSQIEVFYVNQAQEG